ncbi:protealysin inhibitor emfourin [Arthrobacter psychrolactophilus]
MRVTILRGGGLPGIVARTELDAAALPKSAARAFASEVARANLGECPAPPTANPWPDAQLYELRVEESGPTINVRYTEQSLPERVRLLVAWVDGRPERVESIET